MRCWHKIIITISLLIYTSALAGCSGGPGGRNILLTGFWPPTNEMLVQFSPDPVLNPAGWQGQNWRNSGYNVYAYFPIFPGGTETNPAGRGYFMVDYQQTLKDFRRLTDKLRPAAIISFGQGAGPWEIEHNATNCARWTDDYIHPVRLSPFPLDPAVPLGHKRHSSLPAEAIAKAVNNSELDIRAWVDYENDAGSFLCNYMAYIICWYRLLHSRPTDTNRCIAAGFIHVSADIPAEKAAEATEITLQTTIEYVDSTLAGQNR